jgi:leucyl/phenylalanyl-tRNA--protein transferase
MSSTPANDAPPLQWLGFSDDMPVAIGGSLTPETLLSAYRAGIFPWSSNPVVTWWCPNPRAIFELNAVHASRSLRKTIRQSGWTFHIDRDFVGTMQRCAEQTSERPSTWITPDFITAYTKLHSQNLAHCVEVYENDVPVGGLYGISMGGFFGGESMYHRRSNASKAALCFLEEHLRTRGYTLLDAQVMNPHLESLGAIEISREEYLSRLHAALDLPVSFR